MFVVTGTPRAATGYASMLFTEAAVPCAHETVLRPHATASEVVDWYEADSDRGESSWLAWVFFGLFPGPVHVLHTVRDPWGVVDSLAHRNDLLPAEADLGDRRKAYREFMLRMCPRIAAYDGPVDRAAVLVIEWNRLIEGAATRYGLPYLRYRVEDVSATWLTDTLLWMGIYRDADTITQALEAVPRNGNSNWEIQYNRRIVHPAVCKWLRDIAPGREPVASRVLSRATHRTREQIDSLLAYELRDELHALADRYGYAHSLVPTGES